jgi:hypothetical protein
MTDPSSRHRGCYVITMTTGVKFRKKIVALRLKGRGQDELIGGIPPVVK